MSSARRATIISVGGTGNTVQGNLVGTNVAGDFTWENNLNGIVVSGTNHTIGGSAANAGNVVAGAHLGSGIEVQGTGHVIQGNWVGIDKTETIDLGNDHAGIVVGGTGITIGGIGPGEANVIGFNGGFYFGQRRRPRRRERSGFDPGQQDLCQQAGRPAAGAGHRPHRHQPERRHFGQRRRRRGRRRQRPAELPHRHLRVGHAGAGLPRQHALVDLRPRLLRQSRLRHPAERLPDRADLPRGRAGDDGRSGHAAFTATLPPRSRREDESPRPRPARAARPRNSRRASPFPSTRAMARRPARGSPPPSPA